MRRSVLSRSLIVATVIAVAAGAVSVVPASAATPSGITREQIIAAAAVARADPPVDDSPQSAETLEALRPLINRACAVNPSTEQILGLVARATTPDDDAVGIYFQATIVNPALGPFGTRACIEGAVAVTDPAFTLTGSATLGFHTSTTYAMSGDVFVTPVRIHTIFDMPEGTGPTWFTVIGNATRSTSSTVTITTPKTTEQKTAAKKKYSKDVSSAKKTYKKAVKKAGHGKNKKVKAKKAKAKKAYAKKRAAAKATYAKAIATTRSPVTTTQVENRPITMSLED